jgi:transposase, IS5 family
VKTVLTDLGYRGVDADISPVQLVHYGKSRTLSNQQRRWLKRRQAIEPIIGHLKHDHGMGRCWLKCKTGDAVHAVLCAAGYNLRWLLRAIARIGLKAFHALVATKCMKRQSRRPGKSFRGGNRGRDEGEEGPRRRCAARHTLPIPGQSERGFQSKPNAVSTAKRTLIP